MYTLYGGEFTRGLIVQMVLAEGDIDYEYVEVDILNNEHRRSEFLAINPAGYVPVLITPDDGVIHETPAINLYLCERHCLNKLVPMVDEAERGLFLSKLFFLSDDLEPIMKQYYYPHLYVLDETDIPEMKTKSLGHAMSRFAIIEKCLRQNGPYQLGERFSLLDIILSFWLENINFDGQLDDYPALRQCLALVSNRPVLQPFFKQLSAWRVEYARLQAEGGGFK